MNDQQKISPAATKDWLAAWQEGRTRWHRDQFSPSLLHNAHLLKLKARDTLFFPLCGATLDMKWALEQGFKVIGVELSCIAIEEFFNTHKISYQKQDDFYIGEDIKIFHKNIFDLQKEDLESVKAIFDRAAMVALNAEQRKQYIQFLYQMCPKKIKSLLEVFEYDQNLKQGPPFSVSYTYLKEHMPPEKFQFQRLTEQQASEKFAELDAIQTHVYLINYL